MNYKGAVQEFCQKNHLPFPKYETYQVSGKSHNPTFYCEMKIRLENSYTLVFQGGGSSKQEAQRSAAKDCFENLNSEKHKTVNINHNKVIFLDLENQGVNLSAYNQTNCKIYGFASSSHPVVNSKDISNMEIFTVDSDKRDAADILLIAKFVQLFDESWERCYIASSDHFAETFLDCLKTIFPTSKVPVKVLKNYGDYLND